MKIKTSHPHYQVLRDSGFADCVEYLEYWNDAKIPPHRWQGALNVLRGLPYGSTLRETVAHKLRLSERGQI